jgi:hypothetical protein
MRARGVVLSLVVLLAPSTRALADDAPRPTRTPLGQALQGDARALYDGARERFKAGDYPSALAKFQRAHEISHDPRLYWNMAACERKQGHNASVMRLIDAYLREGEAWLTDDDKREASRAAAAVRAFVASATVATSPESGVDVFLDDERIGRTPLDRPLWIDAGLHRVRFAKATFKTIERSEEIRAGTDLSWSVELEPLSPLGPAPVLTPPPTPPPGPKPTAAPTPSPTARPDATSSSWRTGPIVLVALGVTGVALGGVLAGLSLAEFSTERRDCGTACPPSRWQRYRTIQIVGDVALAAGGASLVAGIAWWALVPARSERAWIAPLPGGVAAGGTF